MIYVIGDIHGCLYSFKKMLKELNISKEDKLIALGDVIDRGNFSFECLDLFMNTENFYMIKGNHEMFFEKYMDRKLNEYLWYKFGGNTTLAAIKKMNTDNVLKYYNYIQKLPIYIEEGKYFLVHNGFSLDLSIVKNGDIIDIKKTVEKQYEEDDYNFLISSDIHYAPKMTFDKRIIVGHYPVQRLGENKIVHSKKCIDIDCGATYDGGKLAALRLDDLKEFYVDIDKRDIEK